MATELMAIGVDTGSTPNYVSLGELTMSSSTTRISGGGDTISICG